MNERRKQWMKIEYVDEMTNNWINKMANKWKNGIKFNKATWSSLSIWSLTSLTPSPSPTPPPSISSNSVAPSPLAASSSSGGRQNPCH